MSTRRRNQIKRRNWQRNKRRRERLIADGYTEAEARAIILGDGRALDERVKARTEADEATLDELRAALRKADRRFEVQPDEPQSVRAIPIGGFEPNRRRH
ncbi:MAG TPA: hypothetical protein VK655_09105 [Solirubrobacteraceae bacterium]|nr:hypothetical protein [Solirubrobacteraceae bacterium]